MRTLSLLTPGLFEAAPEWTVSVESPPALLTLLARAQQHRVAAHAADEVLLQWFSVAPAPAPADAPIAVLSRCGEADTVATDGYWLRADPVHLRADQARLLLFGPRLLAVQMTEARLLAAAFNTEYGAAGWRLETPHPQRWYLRLPDDPRIHTQALNAVIGRNIDAFLPQGVNGKHWHSVLNAVQMLFHDNPVNVAREEREQLAINSVWFWGGGFMPVIESAPWTQVCSTDPLARGLARLMGVAVATAPEISAAWRTDGAAPAQLVVLPELQDAVLYGDADAWGMAVASLERDWVTPALAALQRGGLDRLRLYPGNGGVYELSRAGLRRFWRRRRGLDHYK